MTATAIPNPHEALPPTKLHTIRLWTLRIVWIVVTLIVIAAFVAGLPSRLEQLLTVCAGSACSSGQLGAGGVEILERSGLSPTFYAMALTGLESIGVIIFVPIAAFVFWRGFNDWMAILVSLVLVEFAGTMPTVSALVEPNTARYFASVFLISVGNWMLYTLLYLFPNGRFTPRWTRWLAVLMIPLVVVTTTFDPQADGVLGLGQLILGLTPGVIAQIYRYQRVSGPVERQQTKWAVFGFTLAFGGLVLGIMPNFLFPSINVINVPISTPPQLIYVTIAIPLAFLAIYTLPVTIAFSILRYRLWDIDFIIRRTLAYGLVMTVLGAIYVGSITLLQGVFVRVMGNASPLVLVISTLATVALFTPLRRRVQDFVDRQFNRRHYNATRTLERFGDVTRDEVNLEKLESALLAVVDTTMQPTHASLWVQEPTATGKDMPFESS